PEERGLRCVERMDEVVLPIVVRAGSRSRAKRRAARVRVLRGDLEIAVVPIGVADRDRPALVPRKAAVGQSLEILAEPGSFGAPRVGPARAHAGVARRFSVLRPWVFVGLTRGFAADVVGGRPGGGRRGRRGPTDRIGRARRRGRPVTGG